MHHESEWGPRPERECGDEVHILGKKIEPVWPFLDGLRLRMNDAKLQYYSVKIQRKKAEEKLAQLYKDATCVVESRKKGVSFDDIVHICKLPNRQTVLRLYYANTADKNI